MSADAWPDKATLRREVRAGIASLARDTRVEAAHALRDRLLPRLRQLHARRVIAFLSDETEIDLDPTIEALLGAEHVIAVPIVLPERGRMDVARLATLDPDRLDRDRYGLRRPRSPVELLDPGTMDVVLVPGVAFTSEGDRLGRGGGYYDRWLADVPEAVHRIGVCHRLQVVGRMPVEPHDRPVDEVCSA